MVKICKSSYYIFETQVHCHPLLGGELLRNTEWPLFTKHMFYYSLERRGMGLDAAEVWMPAELPVAEAYFPTQASSARLAVSIVSQYVSKNALFLSVDNFKFEKRQCSMWESNSIRGKQSSTSSNLKCVFLFNF